MIELREIEAARARVADVAVRTPQVRLHATEVPGKTAVSGGNIDPAKLADILRGGDS